MPKPIWLKVAEWQGPNPVLNTAAIQGPGNRRTLVWETTAGNGVAVIEKLGDSRRGQFVDLKILNKPFKSVVAQVKRSHTLERKRTEREGRLC
jgi:3-dehydroquinate synthase class II